MRYSMKTLFSSLFLVLFALSTAPLAAQVKNKPQQPPIEEKAARILDKGCNALTALKEYSFVANVTLDKVYQDGSKIQTGRTMEVLVRRPGAFRIVTAGDDIQAVSVFDGRLFTISLPERKVYGQIEAPMDTDALINLLASRYGIESPLGDMLSNTPCAKFNATAGYYVGKSKVEGAVCDHLFFQGKDVDWQIWIEDSPASLPRKLVITERKLPAAPQFTAVFTAWKTDANVTDGFGFAAPEGYIRDDGVITGRKSAKN